MIKLAAIAIVLAVAFTANSVAQQQTDALFEVKHRYQIDLFGDKQKRGWEGWNTHFLETVLEAAKANAGQRFIVIVGAEHSYWLRMKLREQEGVKLIEPGSVLR